MPEDRSEPPTPSSNRIIGGTETERHEENPPSDSSPTEATTWEEPHPDDRKDNNAGWAHESKATITAPRLAYLPNDRECISDLGNQATGAKEQTSPHIPCRAEPTQSEDSLDSTKDHNQGSREKAAHNSFSWVNRVSTQSLHALGAQVAAPSKVHFPDDSTFEQQITKGSAQTEVHDNAVGGDLDRKASLAGRKGTNGFDKTRKLLAMILMERTTCMNGGISRTQARSFEDLTPDNQRLYENAADGFIKWALAFHMNNRDSYGPGTTVHDLMIVKLMGEETKEYLHGEWEYLWVDDDDGIMKGMPIPTTVTQPSRPPYPNDRSGILRIAMPTADDWKWWFGEWKKVPGAIWEWKPREEMWPWQRSYWTEVRNEQKSRSQENKLYGEEVPIQSSCYLGQSL